MSEVTTPTVPLDRLAKVYRKMRDAKGALTATYEADVAKIDGQMDAVTNAMRESLKALGVTSVRTIEGTIVMGKSTRYSVQDWDAFRAFVVEHSAFDLFERRLAQKNTEQFLEENPQLAIPSLVADAKYTISVRKPGA